MRIRILKISIIILTNPFLQENKISFTTTRQKPINSVQLNLQAQLHDLSVKNTILLNFSASQLQPLVLTNAEEKDRINPYTIII